MRLKKLVNRSRIIVAVDFASKKFMDIIPILSRHIAGVKIGLPYLLENRLAGLKELRKEGLYVLADFKLADIPAIMSRIVNSIRGYIDGIIAHGFIGREAISILRRTTEEYGIDLFLVVAMTHKSAYDFINKNFMEFLEIASELCDGVIAPATFPRFIREAREFLGRNKLILSPGVGAQGAKYGEAIKNGADFEIIGRAITLSDNPLSTVIEINKIHKLVLQGIYNVHI